MGMDRRLRYLRFVNQHLGMVRRRRLREYRIIEHRLQHWLPESAAHIDLLPLTPNQILEELPCHVGWSFPGEQLETRSPADAGTRFPLKVGHWCDIPDVARGFAPGLHIPRAKHL